MCKKVDACLGPLAVPQIPNRNCAMYFAIKVDGPLDDLHRDHRPIAPPERCLEWLVRAVFQFQADSFICEKIRNSLTGRQIGIDTRELAEAAVDADDFRAVTHQQSLDGCIGKTAHPIRLELGTAAVAKIDPKAGKR